MSLPILDDIRVASPCTMAWDDMTGGDRVRFCAACQKNVFNLEGMKRAEAMQLLAGTEGRVCMRFYRRKDGTVLTEEDCPVGVRLAMRRARRAVGGVVSATIGAMAAALAFMTFAPARRATVAEPELPTTTTGTYTQTVAVPVVKPHVPPTPKAVKPPVEVYMMGDVALPEGQ